MDKIVGLEELAIAISNAYRELYDTEAENEIQPDETDDLEGYSEARRDSASAQSR